MQPAALVRLVLRVTKVRKVSQAPQRPRVTSDRRVRRVSKATQVAYPGAELVPGMTVGGTDSPFFRAQGSVAYGAGIYAPGVTAEEFATRFHGHDERIDVDSLGLSVDFWTHIAHTICD